MSNSSQKEPENALGAFKDVLGAYHDTSGDRDMIVIPYFVHEAEVMRQEKNHRRLWIALVIAILCLLLSNLLWLWYINQYDFVDYDYSQDGSGVNIIGDRNEVEQDGSEIES